MMKRILLLGIAAALVGALAGCGEKPQTAATHKSDEKASAGSHGNAAYSAPGWKAGDQASWEQQMKDRSQGQNEYARTAAKP
ncbi:MAG: hypothetical protein HY021_04060 [Burkholderiales bacterium]|nr:hypothetical protein [Burkholderiales bacterium]